MVVKLYIGNDKLDLFKDENIVVTSTISDTEDISKNVGDYSKTFTVPASDTNNNIFSHWYDADVDNTFDSRTKVAGRIELDGLPFKVGKWRLSKVNVKSGNPSSYTINFFGRLVSLKSLFKNDELSTLDLSAYDHEYTASNVLTGLQSELFSGAIKYNLLTKKRYYYNSDTADDTDTETISNIAFNGQTVGVRYTDLQPSITVLAIIEAIEDAYDISFSRDFFGRLEFTELYMWVNKEKKADNILKVSQIVDMAGGSGDYDYINPVTSIATFPFEGTGFSVKNSIRITPEVGFEDYNYDILCYSNGVVISNENFTGEGVSRQPELSFEDFEVYYEIRAEAGFKFTANGWGQKIYLSGFSGFTDLNAFSLVNTVSGNLSISANLPKIKIVDFLKGLFSMFKLIVIPLDDTNVYVNTLNDYYSQGSLVDCSRYVDYDSVDVKRGNILNDIKFNFSEPQTLLNTAFKNNTGLAYGDEELLLADEDGEPLDGTAFTVKLPFENMVYERLTDVDTNVLTQIMYGAVIDEEGEGVNIKPHLFYSVNQNVGSNRIGWFDTATSVIDYGSGNINTASHSIDFDTKDYVISYASEFSNWDGQLMPNTLYANYYQDFINAIFNIKRRNWIFKCNLPLSIVLALRLNDIIQIKERYYRISKFDLNLTTGESTLDLINSFDNTVNPFTAGQTIYIIDSNARVINKYVTGTDDFTVDKNDAGDGIDWVNITIVDRQIFIAVDENSSTNSRAIDLLIENTAKTKQIDVSITQTEGAPSFRFDSSDNSQYLNTILIGKS